MDNTNAWVFVSHSNKDFDKIVKVRNKLEAQDYKPLLFFLKCLEDDKEIFELIKREIQARDRFILCESRNARSSEWVQKEKEFIISLNRPYEVIDLDGTPEEIDRSIERFCWRSTIYVWATDDAIAQSVKKAFVEKSFKAEVLYNTYLRDYYYYTHGSRDLCPKDFVDIKDNGYVLLVISRKLTEQEADYIESLAWMFKEYSRACLLYLVAKEAFANSALYYELRNGDGIQPRTIYEGEAATRNDSDCAARIVKDVLKLDNWKFQQSKE